MPGLLGRGVVLTSDLRQALVPTVISGAGRNGRRFRASADFKAAEDRSDSLDHTGTLPISGGLSRVSGSLLDTGGREEHISFTRSNSVGADHLLRVGFWRAPSGALIGPRLQAYQSQAMVPRLASGSRCRCVRGSYVL